MKVFIFFLTAFFAIIFSSFSQSDTDDFDYKTQFVYGINLNTQAGLIGGFAFRYSKAINETMYHSFSLELVDVRHPKEQRRASRLTGEFFTPGKRNFLYVLRPQYGREWILFKKAEERGIQVNAIGAVGPTIGIVAPYIIDYQLTNEIVLTEQYDPNVHTSFEAVLGTSSFAQRLTDAKIQLGASLKTSLSLEFSAFKGSQVGFEAGMMVDAYSKEIEIMGLAQNRKVFTSAFFTLFYGISK
ncbi:hypothetical protein Fleli_0517 [Bernardetia litoralis DSM 6794]|uniref:Outer membrane protein beta-barrel domain-containing protein n=1 Tax=Bernardetia litoralis (strain ATCC 23117 / DSM 6794 / NBRC 15988 / NCIMB 1366 / Fx l1 / Sio-4) TaxID=880071 RepID=I4AGA7_BERLS|nr:hypothetical protein [Bernardetia litoralis]AFM02992.1 hypothetical protein Fleli_0517 [Bernardetia litoralis DSM 6794]